MISVSQRFLIISAVIYYCVVTNELLHSRFMLRNQYNLLNVSFLSDFSALAVRIRIARAFRFDRARVAP